MVGKINFPAFLTFAYGHFIMKNFILPMIPIISGFVVGCQTPKITHVGTIDASVKKIEIKTFHNLYRVANDLYRSEQPNPAGMVSLDVDKLKRDIESEL